MNNYTVIASLRELRDVKFKLTSRAFGRYYDALRQGLCEECRVIRCGALKELQELFKLEEWIASVGGSVDSTTLTTTMGGKCDGAGDAAGRELCQRCRVLRLVNQRLTAWKHEAVVARLRSFLTELAAEEAGRVNALLVRRQSQSC